MDQVRYIGATVNEKLCFGEFLITSNTLALYSVDLRLVLLFSPKVARGQPDTDLSLQMEDRF